MPVEFVASIAAPAGTCTPLLLHTTPAHSMNLTLWAGTPVEFVAESAAPTVAHTPLLVLHQLTQ